MADTGPVERANAEMIAGQNHAVIAAVENREGELALEAINQIILVVFPEVGDEFGIAVRSKGVATALEFGL